MELDSTDNFLSNKEFLAAAEDTSSMTVSGKTSRKSRAYDEYLLCGAVSSSHVCNLAVRSQNSAKAVEIESSSSRDLSAISSDTFLQSYDVSEQWCPQCVQTFPSPGCQQHPLSAVFCDNAPLTLARATLPSSLLLLTKDNIVVEPRLLEPRNEPILGVVAGPHGLPVGALLGPVRSPLLALHKSLPKQQNRFLPMLLFDYTSRTKYQLDLSSEDSCNWTCFLRRACSASAVNAQLFQWTSQLYLITTEVIQPGAEIQIDYAPHYAAHWQLKTLKEFEQRSQVAKRRWRRTIHQQMSSRRLATEVASRRARQLKRLAVERRTRSTPLGCRAANRKELVPPHDEMHCNLCGSTFDNEDLYQLHNNIHPQLTTHTFAANQWSRGYECPRCLLHFQNISNLANHVICEHALSTSRFFDGVPAGSIDSELTHGCGRCGWLTSSWNTLQSHHSEQHVEQQSDSFSSQTSKFICVECDSEFKHQGAFNTHMRSHQSKKHFQCPVCEEPFSSARDLSLHCEEHRIQETGLFQCSHCANNSTSRTYSSFTQLSRHLRQIHSKKVFLCSYCPRTYSRKERLQMHIASQHTGILNYLCEFCAKSFVRKDRLNDHVRRLHSTRKRKKCNDSAVKFQPTVPPSEFERFIYKCRICMLGFKRRGMLVNHLSRRHPDTNPQDVPELTLPILQPVHHFFCPYCKAVYQSSGKRSQHIRKVHPHSLSFQDFRSLDAHKHCYPTEMDLMPVEQQQQQLNKESSSAELSNQNDQVGHSSKWSCSFVTAMASQCPHCPRQYASRQKLNWHIRRVHLTKNQISQLDDEQTFTSQTIPNITDLTQSLPVSMPAGILTASQLIFTSEENCDQIPLLVMTQSSQPPVVNLNVDHYASSCGFINVNVQSHQ